MSSELTSYIEKARGKKQNDGQIASSLLAAGWQKEQITEALAQDSDIPVPPPPVAHVGMWTGFLYILFFIALYVLATSIAGIFHVWIDKPTLTSLSSSTNYPNVSWYDFATYYLGYDTASLVRSYIAAIIVSYPLFVVLAVILKRQILKHPAVRDLRSRKILFYITLIGTFLILLGDIIMTCYDVLANSMTYITFRHLLVSLLIAGPIFAYFISEVKNDSKTS
ncbi:MAG TPA: DUF5671 domain-containing protein [Candidatus Acidoferrales bacterium]|nr:DUF5671 domain-containing protein [Candidatus Acidoferrales bacterium]